MSKWLLIPALLLLTGCAGMKLPFGEERFARGMIETERTETNSDCISFEAFRMVGQALEAQHIRFLSNRNVLDLVPGASALTHAQVAEALGQTCQERIRGLTTDEVRFQLFGGLQNIPNPERLQYLGGILFEFEDTVTDSGLRPSLHLEQIRSGPVRAVVAIYSLEDGQVLHFNYFGTDNVDKRTLDWPLLEFFGFAAQAGAGAITP